jgi:hypothetical protein
MKREETIPIGRVALTQGDLSDVASHAAALYKQVRAREEAEYDRRAQVRAESDAIYARSRAKLRELTGEKPERQTKRQAEMEAASRAAEREAAIDAASRYNLPRFSVATKLSSFEDDDWARLWDRVSTHDVRRITMEGRGPKTSLKVSLDLVSRSSSTITNTVQLTSEDEPEFEREAGFFQSLFSLRKADAALTNGWLSYLVWFIIPALVVGAVVAFVIDALSPDVPSTLLQRAFVTALSALGLSPVLLVTTAPLLDRVAPRVTVNGVGPYQRARENVTGLALTLVSTVVIPIAFVLVPWLLGGATE